MYRSRIPEIVLELPARAEFIEDRIAEMIVEGAQERVPRRTGALHDQIHAERDEHTGGWFVKAGDATKKDFAFYGHIVEHGGALTPAHPFLVPAMEAARAHVLEIGTRVLATL